MHILYLFYKTLIVRLLRTQCVCSIILFTTACGFLAAPMLQAVKPQPNWLLLVGMYIATKETGPVCKHKECIMHIMTNCAYHSPLYMYIIIIGDYCTIIN